MKLDQDQRRDLEKVLTREKKLQAPIPAVISALERAIEKAATRNRERDAARSNAARCSKKVERFVGKVKRLYETAGDDVKAHFSKTFIGHLSAFKSGVYCPPRVTPRDELARLVGGILDTSGIRLSHYEEGAFAKTLRIILPAAGFKLPNDLRDVIRKTPGRQRLGLGVIVQAKRIEK